MSRIYWQKSGRNPLPPTSLVWPPPHPRPPSSRVPNLVGRSLGKKILVTTPASWIVRDISAASARERVFYPPQFPYTHNLNFESTFSYHSNKPTSYLPTLPLAIMATYNQLNSLPGARTVTGSLIFYTRQPRRSIYSPAPSLFGVRRGPIYRTDATSPILPASHRSSRIYATVSSWVGVRAGEGFLEQVEIRTIDASGTLTIRLKHKTDLYVALDAGRLWIRACGEAGAGRFRAMMVDGRQALCDEFGRPWCDWGEAGWNTLGCGEPLWCSFVPDAEKEKVVKLEGGWQPEHEFHWPAETRQLGSNLQVVGV
ncbi:hypothetical protein EDC01DRAFT_323585 [Geopyxis carbonaria]|nr:hypothetical protein EDC01DRAFT_323585 [Geopyxis carbonaria]